MKRVEHEYAEFRTLISILIILFISNPRKKVPGSNLEILQNKQAG